MSHLLVKSLIFVAPLVNCVNSFLNWFPTKLGFLNVWRLWRKMSHWGETVSHWYCLQGCEVFVHNFSQIQNSKNNNQVSRVSTFYSLWAWDPVNWQWNAYCEKYRLTKPINVGDSTSSTFWPQVTHWSCSPYPTTRPLCLVVVPWMSTTSSLRCTSTGARSRRTLWGGAQSTP